MTGLMMKDALVMRKTLRLYALFLLFYSGLAVLGVFPMSMALAMVEVIVMVLPISSFSYDEAAKWDRYAAVLPVGRTAVVKARYLFLLLVLLAAAAIGLVVSWLLGRGSAKLFGLAPDTANAHTLSNMYSNTTFLGIPLMTALYPQGIFCIPIYSLTCNVVLYTVSTGLYMKDSSKKKAGAGEVLRRLANPVTLATLFGIALVLVGLTLPSIAVDIVDRLGSSSSAVSMLYIGTVLTDMDLSVVWKRVSILATVPVRMVAMPLAAFLLLRALNAGELITAVLTVMFALPCQVSISMLAKTGGSDYLYVTEYVLLSTLLSIVTIPIVTTLMAVL